MEDFDFNDTAPAPLSEQEFLMENLCVKKGRAAGGYEPPPTRSAARRWKNINEQNMMTRLNEMHIIKKQNAHMSKEAAREIIRKIPVELLAKEWLSKEDASVDMRAYLVDQILPTLILGVERLLREVDEKGLSATNRYEPEFNPINFLAQYLMRNNPRFSNFAEASPYVRGLREVSEEIKQELFTFEDNRLARIKAETRRKRLDRERYEQEIREGKERRRNQLILQFTEWTNYGERNSVELAFLQNSLSFFLETVEMLPPELQEVAKFGRPLEPTDETGKTLSAKEFAQYISLFVEDLPSEIFNLFMVHMSKCAATQNASADRENRRIILTNLFLICDYGVLRFMIADRKLGLLDRVRIMILFEQFWDKLMETKEEPVATLRNPRRWPIVEVEEVDDILFDAWQDEPDGGILPADEEIQNKLLEAIRVALLEESEINAAKDKAAKEKWKLEQLEEKSAGSGVIQKEEEMGGVGPGSSLVYYLSVKDNPSDETEAKDEDTIDAIEKRGEDSSAAREYIDEDTFAVMKGREKDTAPVEGGEEDALSATEERKEDTAATEEREEDTAATEEREECVVATTEGKEEVTAATEGKEEVTAATKEKEEVTAATEEREEDLAATEEREEDVLATTEGKEEVTAATEGREEYSAATEEREEDTAATEQREEDVLATTEGKEEVTAATEGKKEVTAATEGKEEDTTATEERGEDTLTATDGRGEDTLTATKTKEEDTIETTTNTDIVKETKATALEAKAEARAVEVMDVGNPNNLVEAGILKNGNTKIDKESDLKAFRKSQDLAELEENISNEFSAEINNKKESAFEGNKNGSVVEDHIKETTLDKDIKNISAADRKTDVDVMRDLVASQTKMLASGTYTSSRTKETKITEKTDFAMAGHILELLEDDNTNRNVEDSNVNSCTRARVISASSTAKAVPELSAYSDKFVNLSQFVQMFETFIGPRPEVKIFATLVHYVTDFYQEIESDKTDKLLQAKEKANIANKKAQLNFLFEKWDNDASGFLELEDVTAFMCKFKDGQEVEAIRLAQFDLKKQSEFFDGRLSKREFRQFLNMVIDELPGKETFDLFVKFLTNSVERSYGERIRGEARKKWLQQINLAALMGGTSMDPVYKAVFQALYKDAETHGGEKRISASIAMLEKNNLEPSRGELMLRYAACTPEDCQYMLGKPLYKNMKGVSLQAVETGKPVHVPHVAKHGNIYFWNYNRSTEERSGSFVAIPLKDNKKRVFGTLGVDTMIDPRKEIIFTKHEIQFFQGVAKAFSIAYHYVEKKRKFVHVLERAMPWFHCRAPHIIEITIFFIEPNLKDTNDYVLRKVMVMDNNGKVSHVPELIRLEKKDNMFRRYLFDCVETSYTVLADIHEMRHMACPIRDTNGIVVGLVDLNTGMLKNLPKYESREAQRLLRLLQRAYQELSQVAKGEDSPCVLEVERDPTVVIDIMFERLMLQELRDNIARLDPQSYTEIKGFFEPPRVIAEVLRATIAVFKVDQVGEGEYDDWDDLRNCINSELINNIKTHDPISSARLADAGKLQRYLKATFSVSFGEIAEQGSILAQQLYNWVFACLALIDYMLKKRESVLD